MEKWRKGKITRLLIVDLMIAAVSPRQNEFGAPNMKCSETRCRRIYKSELGSHIVGAANSEPLC